MEYAHIFSRFLSIRSDIFEHLMLKKNCIELAVIITDRSKASMAYCDILVHVEIIQAVSL